MILYRAIVQLLLPIGLGVVAVMDARRRGQPVATSLGLRVEGRAAMRDFAAGVGISFACMLGIVVVQLVSGGIRITGINPGMAFLTNNWPMVAMGVIWNEGLYRVLLLSGLVVYLGGRKRLAVALCAVALGVAQLVTPGVSPVAAIGLGVGTLAYGAAFLGSRSVWLPAGLNLGWTFSRGPIFGIPASGVRIDSLFATDIVARAASGGDPRPAAGWAALVFRVALLAMVVLYLRWRRGAPGGWRAIRTSKPDEQTAPETAAPPGGQRRPWWQAALLIAYLLGIQTAVDAVLNARTPQGSTAWAVSALTVPYLSVPAYWFLGQSTFHGYVNAHQLMQEEIPEDLLTAAGAAAEYFAPPEKDAEVYASLQNLSRDPFLRGNEVELLVDGDATFDSIVAGMERAEEYILFQFYILRDDALGQRVAEVASRKAREGVQVYMLYDEVGSQGLSWEYLRDLREAGVQIYPFMSSQEGESRFQLNFRNHRKIVVVDGREAWVGGHNVGVEYLGQDPKFGHWRDTHIRIEGPTVLTVQLIFFEDWLWATKQKLDVPWSIHEGDGDVRAMTLGTGPSDERERAQLSVLQLIQAADERLWIASPYFVPDDAILHALKVADSRGVDVRILIPNDPDHILVYLSAFAFLDQLKDTGIRIYRYTDGFLHQKVFLVDDDLSMVGTMNLDNRSMRLNFEVGVMVADEGFAKEIEAMLEEDFAHATIMENGGDFASRPFPFRLAAKFARLMAPVQ